MCRNTSIVLLLVAALAGQPVWGQAGSPAAATSTQPFRPDYTRGADWWPRFTNVYQKPIVPEADFANSDRLERLLRDGNMYLSIQDAIALGLENNLDIAYTRYEPLLADTDILRSRAGGSARATGGGISNQSTGGITGGTTIPSVSFNAAGGPPIPQLDPSLTGNFLNWAHLSTPTQNTTNTGTNTVVTERTNSAITYSQGFLTGTMFSLGFNTANISSNNLRNTFNPVTNSAATLNFRQSLLQGFGRSLNSRQIRIARNNREVSDLVFKQQVITTVAQIQNLYWDLVSFVADVSVKQEALRVSQQFLRDNQRQVEIGTMAPIETIRAEAEVASRQQDLTVSQTRVQQQETILKNALSKNGLASLSISEAHIVPTSEPVIPATEPIEPIQDLMSTALQARPELAQSRIRLTNADISLKATRNAMLPTLDFVASMTNNAQAGSLNEAFLPLPGQTVTPPPDLFNGGLGTTFTQIFKRNFPDYSVGVQFTVPIRNRAAQADMAATQLQYRQQEIRMRQAENAVRVDVRNAVVALQQARAGMESAQRSRILQEQTLDAETKKYALGASTTYVVIQVQRDLAAAKSVEVQAKNTYTKARVQLDLATGQTLVKQNVVLDEAYDGVVKRAPDPIPARPPAQP